MDRIDHPEIETFKRKVHGTRLHGRTILEWNRLLSRGSEDAVRQALSSAFDVQDDERPVVT